MAITTNSTIKLVKKYIKELEKNNIPIQKVIIFGSQVNGKPKEESDIDIALISTAFTGNRFDDSIRIIPLRRKIDSRIEPIPFRPEDFDHGGVLADEIKKTGKIIINRR